MDQNDEKAGEEQAHRFLGTGGVKFGEGRDPNVGKKTQFKKGQSGNPTGRKKGSINLSTRIQQLMNDESFIDRLSERVKQQNGIDASDPDQDFQSTPMDAILSAAIIEAMNPNAQPAARHAARDYLSKYGYGTKVTLEPSEDAKGLFGVAALTVKVVDGTRDNTQPQTTDGV